MCVIKSKKKKRKEESEDRMSVGGRATGNSLKNVMGGDVGKRLTGLTGVCVMGSVEVGGWARCGGVGER